MKFEIKRKIDDLGRLCIPVAFRDYYGIGSGDRVVLLSVRNGVQIAKAEFFVPEQIPRELRFPLIGLDESLYHVISEGSLCLCPTIPCVSYLMKPVC